MQKASAEISSDDGLSFTFSDLSKLLQSQRRLYTTVFTLMNIKLICIIGGVPLQYAF